MRTAMVCLMLLFTCLQVAGAAPGPAADPIVPVLTLTIQPPILKVQSAPNSTAVAQFNGTATVDKMVGMRCVVTLASSTDIGWVSEISPSTMVFTSESPQSYTVAVSVPPATPTSQGTLVINGRAVCNGLQSMATAQAKIDVTGPIIINLTATNGTLGNATGAGGTVGGSPTNVLMFSVLAVVLIAVPAGGYVYYRRRRQRSPGPEA